MLITKLLLLHHFWTLGQGVSLMPSNRAFKFDRFDGMCRSKNVPIRINYAVTKSEALVIYMNATIHVSENITGDPLKYLKLRRCRSRENLDTCEDFLEPRPSSYCDSLDPKYVCPITKGSYHVYNFKMDLSNVAVFPLGSYYWRASLELRDRVTNRLLSCFKAEVHLVKSH